MQTERSSTAGTGVVSKVAAAVLLMTCLVVGIVIGARGPSASAGYLRAQTPASDSLVSRRSASGSEERPAGSLVLPNSLKHRVNEELDIDVGSPAGAWGPDDEEKDDWKTLFGARVRGSDASPEASLPSFDDLMMTGGDMSFSFSYDYSDEGSWFS